MIHLILLFLALATITQAHPIACGGPNQPPCPAPAFYPTVPAAPQSAVPVAPAPTPYAPEYVGAAPAPVPFVPGYPGAAPAGAAVAPAEGYYLASDGQYYPNAATTTEAPTTKGPPNRFNQAGWETDDNGNVFIGDDKAKLYLITVGSYWPFPKDYRKKRDADTQTLPEFFDKIHF